MKITVVGGGSTYTPELIDGIVKIQEELNITELCLLDIPKGQRKLDILEDFSRRMLQHKKSPIKLWATMDSREAFKGCQVVINQFRAGGLQGRINDERIPMKYGLIGQETTGMGGMANGIRALGIVKKYLDEIRSLGIEPWIINFANPSGMLTEYMTNYLKYPKVIGVCNVAIEFIFHMQKIFQCSREELFMKYYGLNHLTWIEEIWVKGVNRTAELYENFSVNMKNIPDLDYKEDFLPSIKMLLNSYLKYYYNRSAMVKELKKDMESGGTRGQEVARLEEQLLEKYEEPHRMEPPEELSWRGGFMYSTVALELIRDIYRGDGSIHIVNVQNQGALSDLPHDYVLEIPARITKNGPVPIPLGETALLNRGLIHTIKSYQRLTIQGFMDQREDLIKQAMLIHPLGPGEENLNALWSELKDANGDFFPSFH